MPLQRWFHNSVKHLLSPGRRPSRPPPVRWWPQSRYSKQYYSARTPYRYPCCCRETRKADCPPQQARRLGLRPRELPSVWSRHLWLCHISRRWKSCLAAHRYSCPRRPWPRRRLHCREYSPGQARYWSPGHTARTPSGRLPARHTDNCPRTPAIRRHSRWRPPAPLQPRFP